MKRRVRLFIGGMEVEFDSVPDILYNFQVDSLTEPAALKNSYSKTITIPGTKENDKVFDSFFLNDYHTNGNFDASKKTDFTIYVDSDIFETGYCKLDKVTNNKHYHAYQVSLFGGLGELFYNLDMTDNPTGEDNKRKISDLEFYPSSSSTTPIEIGFTINKETIADAWSGITNDSSQYSCISFAPAYNGLPSDFDADKVLMNVPSVTPSGSTDGRVVRRPGGRGSIIVTAVTESGETYTTKGGYAVGELSREYTGAEMREFRSYLQRPVLSVRRTLEAISRPENNGGFQIEWDSEWANQQNPYWQDLYVTLPMLSTLEYNSSVVSTGTTISLGATNRGTTAYSANTADPTYYEKTNATLSDSDSGYSYDVQVKLTLSINGVSDTTNDRLVLCAKGDTSGSPSAWNYAQGVMVQLVAFDYANNPVAGSQECYITSAFGTRRVSEGRRSQIYPYFLERNQWLFPAVYGNEFYSSNGNYFVKNSGSRYDWDEEITLTAQDVPAGSTLKVIVTEVYKNANVPNSNRTIFYRDEQPGEVTRYYLRTFTGFDVTINSSKVAFKTNEGIRTGAGFTKHQLLDTDYSPYEFLTSYMKIFGLYAVKDKIEKKVQILTRKNFFQRDNIVDVQDLIDRQSLEITPLVFNNKWYSWNLNADESEYGKAYEETYGKPYGQAKINTGYAFNRTTKEVLDKNIFKNAVQVLERSNAFCYTGEDTTSKPWMFPGYKYLLYNQTDSTDTYEVEVPASSTIDAFSAFTEGYMYYDLYDKVQLHSADNSPADGTNVLLFLNGSVELTRGDKSLNYYITDDNSYMNLLNEAKPCWLFTNSETDGEGNSIAIKLTEIPYFNRYLIYPATGYITRSLDFGAPEEIYVPNAIYRPGSTIYDEFWKDYISDLYDKDSRVIKTKMLIKEKPSVDWLRRFYYFDNSIWRMTEINDYDIANDKLTEVKFVRVQDINKYTSVIPTGEGTLTITLSNYMVANSGGSVQYTITLSNGGDWYITSYDPDTTLSATSGTGDYTGTWTIPASGSRYDVERSLTVASGNLSARAYLTQAGITLSVNGPLEQGDVSWAGGTRTFTIISPDSPWSAKTDYSSIITSITPSAGTATNASGVTVTATFSQNSGSTTRDAYIYAEATGGITQRSSWARQEAFEGANIVATPDYIGNVPYAGSGYTILVTSSEPWTGYTSYPDSVTFTPSTGASGTTEVSVNVLENDGAARFAQIYFYREGSPGSNPAVLTISQQQNENASISVVPDSVTGFTKEGGTFNAEVTSTNNWSVYLYNSNLLVSPTMGGSGTTQVLVTISDNDTGEDRNLKARFYIGNSPNDVYDELNVQQSASSVTPTETITITPDFFGNVPAAGSGYTATLYSTEPWTAYTTYQNILVVSPVTGNSGTTLVSLAVSPNDGAARFAQAYFYRESSPSSNPAVATIHQDESQEAFISVVPSSVSDFATSGGTFTANVTSSNDWSAYLFSQDMLVSPSTGSSGTTQVNVMISQNTTGLHRNLKTRFYIGSSPNELYDELEVGQRGGEGYENQYFTLNILSGGTIIWQNANSDPGYANVQYSMDEGNTWYDLATELREIRTLYVSTGDKVMIKGNNANIYFGSDFLWNSFHRDSTAVFDVEGNLLSLLYGDDFASYSGITKEGQFKEFFYSLTTMHSAQNLVMPKNAPNEAYNNMFISCSSLVSAPSILPAAVVGDGAYQSMFSSCVSLVNAPVISATQLGTSACAYMFNACTSLVTAPQLPATDFITIDPDYGQVPAGGVYENMFSGCESLVNPPSLPATAVTHSCYYGMFEGCSSLVTAPNLPATTLSGASICYANMFRFCTSLVNPPVISATTLSESCFRYMFQGCTALQTAPDLIATYLPNKAYYRMFYECSNLSSIKCLATDKVSVSATNSNSPFYKWTEGVAENGTFTKPTNINFGYATGINGIPSNWTIVEI